MQRYVWSLQWVESCHAYKHSRGALTAEDE